MAFWDAWAADPRYSQVVMDPRYLSSTPAFKNKIHDVLFKYGFTGTPDQEALAGGPVENNAYSVANLLKQGRTNADHSTYNAANAAGLEESGAAAAGLNANNEDYKRGVSEATARMGGELNDATSTYTSGINDIFGSLEANPVAAPQPSPMANLVDAQPVGVGTGLGTGLPVPQQPYTRSGPEAGGPMTPKSQSIVNKLKAPKGFSGRAL